MTSSGDVDVIEVFYGSHSPATRGNLPLLEVQVRGGGGGGY